jgi:spermidine/putrescine transport system ATP-binding protein
MEILQLEHLDKFYGANHVVKDLNLSIRQGEFLTVLGPSGCGKTTTLRMIGGFELPNRGTIRLRGADITDLPPYRRNVNTVFQNYALFPNMTVEENVAFGLQQKKKTRAEISRKVAECLEMVRMGGFGKRKPQELSGGQQQRIAIARAVANDPDILLLDEPLGALDLKLRKQMQLELKTLHRDLNKTFVYVTHDQEEALVMSDRIAVMNGGVLEQLSDAHDLYYRPRTRFVADFIGEANILNGRLVESLEKDCRVDVAGLAVRAVGTSLPCNSPVSVFVRPESVRLERGRNGHWSVAGTVTELLFVGSFRKYGVTLPDGTRLVSSETTLSPETFRIGDPVFVSWDESKTSVFGMSEP